MKKLTNEAKKKLKTVPTVVEAAAEEEQAIQDVLQDVLPLVVEEPKAPEEPKPFVTADPKVEKFLKQGRKHASPLKSTCKHCQSKNVTVVHSIFLKSGFRRRVLLCADCGIKSVKVEEADC